MSQWVSYLTMNANTWIVNALVSYQFMKRNVALLETWNRYGVFRKESFSLWKNEQKANVWHTLYDMKKALGDKTSPATCVRLRLVYAATCVRHCRCAASTSVAVHCAHRRHLTFDMYSWLWGRFRVHNGSQFVQDTPLNQIHPFPDPVNKTRALGFGQQCWLNILHKKLNFSVI